MLRDTKPQCGSIPTSNIHSSRLCLTFFNLKGCPIPTSAQSCTLFASNELNFNVKSCNSLHNFVDIMWYLWWAYNKASKQDGCLVVHACQHGTQDLLHPALQNYCWLIHPLLTRVKFPVGIAWEFMFCTHSMCGFPYTVLFLWQSIALGLCVEALREPPKAVYARTPNNLMSVS